MNLCLAITTYNRLDYLQNCLETWKKTKNNQHDWKLIVADDGSTDGTLEYLQFQNCTIINNYLSGVHFQTNTIIEKLQKIKFDFCFKIDDDMFFKKWGWDDLYLKAIEKTKFEHLVFFDKSRKATHSIKKPYLESSVRYEQVLGCFYTLSPKIIKRVGYFDIKNFGKQESGHIDYTYRCCLAGFNDPENPFDAADSNQFIGIKWKDNDKSYRPSLPENERDSRRSKYDPVTNKKQYEILLKNRSPLYSCKIFN